MLHCLGSLAVLRGQKMYFSRYRHIVTAVPLSLCHLLNTPASHMSQHQSPVSAGKSVSAVPWISI